MPPEAPEAPAEMNSEDSLPPVTITDEMLAEEFATYEIAGDLEGGIDEQSITITEQTGENADAVNSTLAPNEAQTIHRASRETRDQMSRREMIAASLGIGVVAAMPSLASGAKRVERTTEPTREEKIAQRKREYAQALRYMRGGKSEWEKDFGPEDKDSLLRNRDWEIEKYYYMSMLKPEKYKRFYPADKEGDETWTKEGKNITGEDHRVVVSKVMLADGNSPPREIKGHQKWELMEFDEKDKYNPEKLPIKVFHVQHLSENVGWSTEFTDGSYRKKGETLVRIAKN